MVVTVRRINEHSDKQIEREREWKKEHVNGKKRRKDENTI